MKKADIKPDAYYLAEVRRGARAVKVRVVEAGVARTGSKRLDGAIVEMQQAVPARWGSEPILKAGDRATIPLQKIVCEWTDEHEAAARRRDARREARSELDERLTAAGIVVLDHLHPHEGTEPEDVPVALRLADVRGLLALLEQARAQDAEVARELDSGVGA